MNDVSEKNIIKTEKTEKSLSKLEKMKKQKDVLAARIQKLEASEKSRERKRDTRRKILVGSFYLDKAKKENTMDNINAVMDDFLIRESDRVLFDIPKRKE